MKKTLLLLFALLLAMPSLVLAQDCQTPENIEVNVVLNDPDYGKKYKIILTWDAVEGAEKYAIYFNNKYYTDMYMGESYTNEFIIGSDVGQEDGADVFYLSVRTICDSENMIVSDISEGVSVILSEDIGDSSAVEAPANVTASALSTSSIELTWDAAENAKSYFVYRNGEEIANITETSYVDENLEYDTEYCYTVTTMGVDTESDPSEEVCKKTLSEGIEELTSSLNIYPNPVNDMLFIETETEIEEVTIYNLTGVAVYNVQCTKNNVQLDITNLNEGVYFVKVRTNNNEVVKRIMKL